MCASIKPGMTKRPFRSSAPSGTDDSWASRTASIFRLRMVMHIRSCGRGLRPSMTRAFQRTRAPAAIPVTSVGEEAVADGFAESRRGRVLAQLIGDQADRFVDRLRAEAKDARLDLVPQYITRHHRLDREHGLQS